MFGFLYLVYYHCYIVVLSVKTIESFVKHPGNLLTGLDPLRVQPIRLTVLLVFKPQTIDLAVMPIHHQYLSKVNHQGFNISILPSQ